MAPLIIDVLLRRQTIQEQLVTELDDDTFDDTGGSYGHDFEDETGGSYSHGLESHDPAPFPTAPIPGLMSDAAFYDFRMARRRANAPRSARAAPAVRLQRELEIACIGWWPPK